jgi:hypothetical protein
MFCMVMKHGTMKPLYVGYPLVSVQLMQVANIQNIVPKFVLAV